MSQFLLELLPSAYTDANSKSEMAQISTAFYGAIQEEINLINAKIDRFITDWVNPDTAIEENIDNYLRWQLNFTEFWRKDWDISAKRWLCHNYRWVWGAADSVSGCNAPNYTRVGIERLFQVFGLNARIRSAGEFILDSSVLDIDTIDVSLLNAKIQCAATYQPYSREHQTIELIKRVFISAHLDVEIQRTL